MSYQEHFILCEKSDWKPMKDFRHPNKKNTFSSLKAAKKYIEKIKKIRSFNPIRHEV